MVTPGAMTPGARGAGATGAGVVPCAAAREGATAAAIAIAARIEPNRRIVTALSIRRSPRIFAAMLAEDREFPRRRTGYLAAAAT